MNIREIHEIIQQISETLTCPRCRARVLPQCIQVAEIHPNGDYLFDVECKQCDAEMSLSAHVERVAPAAATNEPSTPAKHAKENVLPISEEEVLQMTHALRNFCGSFIKAFS